MILKMNKDKWEVKTLQRILDRLKQRVLRENTGPTRYPETPSTPGTSDISSISSSGVLTSSSSSILS
jgi:hypothetical protein